MTQALTTPAQSAPMSLLIGADLSTVDTDKLEKLMELQERYEAKQADKALASALAEFQSTAPSTFKGRKSDRGQFASLDDIMLAIRSSLASNGLSISFDTETPEAGKLTAVCHVLHKDGGTFSRSVTVPVDSAMRANDTQKMGSAISYAKRYALTAALNLIVSDHDDDANSAGESWITPDQSSDIHELLETLNDPTVKPKMLQWLGVAKVEEIPASKYDATIKNLRAKLKP
jgi:hypothetical protein